MTEPAGARLTLRFVKSLHLNDGSRRQHVCGAATDLIILREKNLTICRRFRRPVGSGRRATVALIWPLLSRGQSGTSPAKAPIATTVKVKSSPARLAQVLQPSLA